MYNRFDIIKFIIEFEDIDINTPPPPFGTPVLHWAIPHVDYEVIEYLLKRGADPNFRDYFNHTALYSATLQDMNQPKWLKIIELLKKYHAVM